MLLNIGSRLCVPTWNEEKPCNNKIYEYGSEDQHSIFENLHILRISNQYYVEIYERDFIIFGEFLLATHFLNKFISE